VTTVKRARRLFEHIAQANFGAIRRSLQHEYYEYRVRRGLPVTYDFEGVKYVWFPDWKDSDYQRGHHPGNSAEYEVFRAWLQQPGHVFDVGANAGYFSIAMKAILPPEYSVVAIEPNPQVARRLRQSIRMLKLKNVKVVERAITDRVETLRFYIPRDLNKTDVSSLSEQWVSSQTTSEIVQVDVQTSTLEIVAKEILGGAKPTAVKLDVEGSELAALRGAPASWFDGSVLWMFEVVPRFMAKSDTQTTDLTSRFAADTFELWLIPQAEVDPPAPRQLAPEEPYSDAPFYNVLAIPKADRRASSAVAKLTASAS
jgi:FkbM family methyltransferase